MLRFNEREIQQCIGGELHVEGLKNLSDTELVLLLAESDRNMARVFEDTIRVMLKVGTIQLHDLPDAASEVMEKRSQLREILTKKRSKKLHLNTKTF